MDFATLFRQHREGQNLTQADISAITGIARPNIAAYEAGRREPKVSTAVKLLAAVNAEISVNSTVTWGWTQTPRPYAVPSRLWRLPLDHAFATISTSDHVWWSGPQRTFDLADRRQRQRAYELFLREGGPDDIKPIVDGALLIDVFETLVLPRPLRHAWQAVIRRHLDPSVPQSAA